MNQAGGRQRRRIALLFTRYPVLSERFLLREVQALDELGVDIAVYPTWRGGDPSLPAPALRRAFRARELYGVLWRIPYWAWRRPQAMVRLAQALVGAAPPDWLNFWENLLGMGFGLVRAQELERECDHLHAVWASAPATAAWTVHLLTGLPYSLAGHAYDLFEHGGDWLLPEKLSQARFVRSSTLAGTQRLLQLGATPAKVHLVRRGLPAPAPDAFAQQRPAVDFPPLSLEQPLRLLAVGRLVEKMGYPLLLAIAAQLHRRGLDFRLRIIGDGPLRHVLQQLGARLGLTGVVEWCGALPYAEVDAAYRRADLLLFTGMIARSGDRAGFPNVIGEAMAAGVPVCCTVVGAVGEAIIDGETGVVLDPSADPAGRILAALADPAALERMRRRAWQWVRSEFDLLRNMSRLADLLGRG